jgi:predicted Zn finger-like uncharacterized protein
MKVACKQCGATYDIKDERIPPSGMSMKCPKCLSSFRVTKEGASEENQGLERSRTILGIGLKDQQASGKGAGAEKKPFQPPSKPPWQASSKPPWQAPPKEDQPAEQKAASELAEQKAAPKPLVPSPVATEPKEGGEGRPSAQPALVTPPPDEKKPGGPAKQVPTTLQGMGKGGEGDERELYVKRYTGRVFGPFPPASIKTMLEEGKLEGNEEVSTDRQQWKPIGDHPLLGQKKEDGGKTKGSEPELPAVTKKQSSAPDLPSPKKQKSSEPELPAVRKKQSSAPDLPSPKKQKSSEPELPAVRKKQKESEPDLPAARSKQEGSEPDLPAAMTSQDSESRPDLPVAAGEKERQGIDLPAEIGVAVDGGGQAGLPTPKSQAPPPVPAGGGSDLPAEKEKSHSPEADLPAASEQQPGGGGGVLDLSELDLVEPKQEESQPTVPAEAQGGEADRASGARELDLGAEEPVELSEREPRGASPIDLDELDVVLPGEEPKGEPSGITSIEPEPAAAEELETVPPAGKPTIQKQPPSASWLEENKKLVVTIAGGVVLVAALAVGAFHFLKQDEPASSAAGRSRGTKPSTGSKSKTVGVAEMWGDTPADFRKAFTKARAGLRRAPNDPVAAATVAKVAYAFAYRYEVKGKGYDRARASFKKAVSSGTDHGELRKARALSLLLNGKPKGAAGLTSKKCSKSKPEPESCILWGWASRARGKGKTARAAFQRALHADPDNITARVGLARSYLLAGDTEKAIEELVKAIKAKPSHREARLLRTLAELRENEEIAGRTESKKAAEMAKTVRKVVAEGKKAKVERTSRLAVAVEGGYERRVGNEDKGFDLLANAGEKSKDPLILIEHGWALHGSGRWKECRDVFREALDKARESLTASEGLARCLVGMGEGDSALGVVRKAWKIHPKNASVRVLRGQVNLARGKPDSAEKYYKKALAVDPRHAPAYVAWIRLKTRDGEGIAGAHAQLEQLAVQGVKSPELVFLRGELFEKEGKLEQAEKPYREAIQLRPDRNEYRVALGRVLVDQGKLDQGLETLEVVWKRAKCEKGVAEALAAYYRRSKNMERAIRVLKKGADHRPTVPVKLALAELYLKVGGKKNARKAIDFLAKLVTERRMDPRVNRMLGRAYLAVEKIEEAQRHLKSAVAYGEKDTAARLLLAKSYIAEGKTGRGVAELKEALQHDPDAYDVLEYRAEIAFHRGAVLAALKDLSRVLEKQPRASAYTLKAQCLLERRKRRAAQKALARAIKLEPRYPKAHFVLGQIRYRRGKLRGAVKSLRRAVTFLEERDAEWEIDAHYMLGSAFASLRDKRQAKKHLKKYLEMTKGDRARKSTRREVKRKLRRLRY